MNLSFDRRKIFQTLLGWTGLPGFAGAAAATQTSTGGTRKPGALGGYILDGKEEVLRRSFDVVVIGGGISGTCAAISAARNGAKTALVHERSMLGGNSSSEVRLYPEVSTNHSVWCKETGILDEIHTEERVRNHEPYVEGLMNAVWDLVLYEWVVREPNLTLFLNTTVREVEMKDPATILAVHGVQMGTERKFLFTAPLFVDATGDGVIGHRSGAEFRWGMEARSEFGEPAAPVEASARPQMGNTLFFRARDAGVPVPFKAPPWIATFPAEADLAGRSHADFERGYWWIEVGLPMHQIRDNEEIKHEALRQLLGVWDHIKNRCANRDKARNHGLDFVSFWPYKREASRIVGDYILTQHDVNNPRVHPDAIGFGCWYVDIHKPGGILARGAPNTKPSWEEAGVIPYGIPLRACYSRNVANLMMAGRPISTTYAAFSSTRVLRTGAIVGQGVGVAAALCRKHGCLPRELARTHAPELRQTLLRQDCYVPGYSNEDPADLARGAVVTSSGDAPLEFPEGARAHPLDTPAAQLFPVSGARVDFIDLLLVSNRDDEVDVRAGLRRADFVYDFRSTTDITAATARVPPRSRGYVRFAVHRAVEPGRLYWIHLPRVPGLSWLGFEETFDAPALSPVGCTAAELPGLSRWHPITRGVNFTMRIEPGQRPYGAENLVRGGNRPDRWPNIFVSRTIPAWVELRWPSPVVLQSVELTFDTDINRHSRKALFRYPDCVKSYDILVPRGSGWSRVAGDADNYFRWRAHSFEAVTADRLRVEINETNGAACARMYEIRVYGA